MNFNLDLLYGIYRLSKIESKINGLPTGEKANDGMFVFTRDNQLSVVSGSNEWVMAYTGNFEIKDNIIYIDIKSCVTRDMEGTRIQRKIVKLDGINLVLDVSGSDKSKSVQISWIKIAAL